MSCIERARVRKHLAPIDYVVAEFNRLAKYGQLRTHLIPPPLNTAHFSLNLTTPLHQRRGLVGTEEVVDEVDAFEGLLGEVVGGEMVAGNEFYNIVTFS